MLGRGDHRRHRPRSPGRHTRSHPGGARPHLNNDGALLRQTRRSPSSAPKIDVLQHRVVVLFHHGQVSHEDCARWRRGWEAARHQAPPSRLGSSAPIHDLQHSVTPFLPRPSLAGTGRTRTGTVARIGSPRALPACRTDVQLPTTGESEVLCAACLPRTRFLAVDIQRSSRDDMRLFQHRPLFRLASACRTAGRAVTAL